MSAGIIWYKNQPDSRRSDAVLDLLSDYCGFVKSHDVTVHPGRIPLLISNIFSRCDNVIIIGGAECRTKEENIVFILSRALGIPLETKYRSRSRYCYDRLRALRLPSLAGSVLFPTRQGCVEGILLRSGTQCIIVLPANYRLTVAAAVSMREFFIPEVTDRRRAASAHKVQNTPEAAQKDYEKFRRNPKTAPVTREYSEYQLIETMERASRRAHEDSPDDTAFDYMYDDENRGGT